MAVRCGTAGNGFLLFFKKHVAKDDKEIRATGDAEADPSTNLEAAVARLYEEKLKGESLLSKERSKQIEVDNIARNIQLKAIRRKKVFRRN